MPFSVLASVRSHKGIELHFGLWKGRDLQAASGSVNFPPLFIYLFFHYLFK